MKEGKRRRAPRAGPGGTQSLVAATPIFLFPAMPLLERAADTTREARRGDGSVAIALLSTYGGRVASAGGW
jgi:hypothetical protein